MHAVNFQLRQTCAEPVACACLLLCIACSGAAQERAADFRAAVPTAAASAAPAVGELRRASPTDCPAPVGTPEEIGASPRADSSIELLAMDLEPGSMTADPALYERLSRDLAAIRQLAPELADLQYRSPHDGKSLILQVTASVAQAIASGRYESWNCLNDFYGLRRIEPVAIGSTHFVMLELKGIYGLEAIAARYAELPGVLSVDTNALIGDGPTICALRAGTVVEYVLDRRGGDCPAGCTTLDAFYFSVAQDGAVESRGRWQGRRFSAENPRPAWYDRVCGGR